jgi:hypothetical protein
LVAKALVDILVHEGSLTDPSQVKRNVVMLGKEWKKNQQEPGTNPLSPRMITWSAVLRRRKINRDIRKERRKVP